MIPPVLDPKTLSPGEREAFHRLQDDPSTEGWIVLHSLDIPNHRRRLSGEIDFVILVPRKGVLCLEVKAHHKVSRRDGLWYMGADNPDPRGPFKQASESMHSLRNRLVKRRGAVSGVLFWSAVLFPYVRFKEVSEEWHPWQVIDADDWAATPLSNSVLRVLDTARAFIASAGSSLWFREGDGAPSPEQCEIVSHVLRPDFEFFESPRSRQHALIEELKRYTDEQTQALDAMEQVPRVVFEGPGGTGKTLLAIETARRESLRNRRVLLLCFNRFLARWLQEQTRQLSGVVTRTFHSYLLDLARVTPQEDAGPVFWERDLPERAADALLERTERKGTPFDALVVDEAQDIMQHAYLDTLDLSLAGGLGGGQWRFFSDFARQSIFGGKPLTLDDLFARLKDRATLYLLRTNCRNTPRIAAYVSLLSRLEPDYARVLRPDDGEQPELVFYDSAEAQRQALKAALEKLYTDGYRGEDIVVLSTADRGCARDLTEPPWSDRLRPFGTFEGGYVGYTTVHAFKGLEAPVIIVTDVDSIGTPEAENLLYVAMTRAVDRLVILVSGAAKSDVVSAITGSELDK